MQSFCLTPAISLYNMYSHGRAPPDIKGRNMQQRTRTARIVDGRHLDVAAKDARRFLDWDQYAHAIGLFDELATEENPRLSRTQDIRPIEGLYELRDKGGVLGRINLRVYFDVIDEGKLILVLGCVVTTMKNRRRHAQGGTQA